MMKKGAMALCLLLLALCGCGKEEQTDTHTMDGYAVPMVTRAGSGFFWECAIADESIVRVEASRNVAEDTVGGNPVNTEFVFYGLHFGETTVNFTCSRNWESEIVYHQSCQLIVDENLAVTGKMGLQEVTIQTDMEECEVSVDDISLLTWTEEEPGIYRISPLRDGNSTVHFEELDEEGTPVAERAYYISVDSAGNLAVSEAEVETTQTGSFESTSELEEVTGIPMVLPEGYQTITLSDVGGLSYITFLWNGMEVSYIGGDLGMDTTGAATWKISGQSVQVIADENGTVAVWKQNDMVYYITCERELAGDDLIDLISPIIRANQ